MKILSHFWRIKTKKMINGEDSVKNMYGDLEHTKKSTGYLTAKIFLFK